MHVCVPQCWDLVTSLMEIKLPAFEESLAYSDPVEIPNYHDCDFTVTEDFAPYPK